jgi:hypothetical protein
VLGRPVRRASGDGIVDDDEFDGYGTGTCAGCGGSLIRGRGGPTRACLACRSRPLPLRAALRALTLQGRRTAMLRAIRA